MPTNELVCRRRGIVSIWTGTFPTLEAAEEYFGIPDEIGVCLLPAGFLHDLGWDDLPDECLEVDFEQMSPRPLRELLKGTTFSAGFIGQALQAARQQGIQTAQGIALLYDFDYQAHPGWQRVIGPLRFIGSFPFFGTSTVDKPRPNPRIDVRDVWDDVL